LNKNFIIYGFSLGASGSSSFDLLAERGAL
jgi:hypothetical protein